MRGSWRPLSVVFLTSLMAADASGQQVVTLEFSFSNPGARSMGLGGAFAALADDATAAYANPAGLVQLAEPEVSIEGRSWSYTTPFTIGGRASGQPTGIGLDTDPGIRRAESTADFTEVSFLSFVFPMKRWSIALYRHQLARFASSTAIQGFFGNGPGFADTLRIEDRQGRFDLDLVNYGLSLGVRAHESLSLGIGLSYLDGELIAQEQIFLPDDDSFESYFGENSYLPERMALAAKTASDDTDLSAILGFLWRTAPRWSLGGFYRFGLGVDLETEVRTGPAHPQFPAVAREPSSLSLPDVFGLGVAFRARDGRLTGSLEWDHVEYSSIFESLGESDEAIPDADEVHLGLEYAFLESTPVVAVRLGAWLDPDHRIRGISDDPFLRTGLPPGDDEIHLATGLGLAFEKFQIDLGADFSELVDTVSVSGIYSF
jgi:long-subunit fatty acid transport protein